MKVAAGQVWENSAGGQLVVKYVGDSLGIWVRGSREFHFWVSQLQDYKLVKHQNGHVLEKGFEYRDFGCDKNSTDWDYWTGGGWHPSKRTSSDLLYRRPASLLTKYDLKIGGLYYKPSCVLMEVLSEGGGEVGIMKHDSDGSSVPSMIGELNSLMFARSSWTEVERDSKEAQKFFRPKLPEGWLPGILAPLTWYRGGPTLKVDGVDHCPSRGQGLMWNSVHYRVVGFERDGQCCEHICGLNYRATHAVLVVE